MKLTPGEIYFIGEREHETGKVTPYYKIGIVRENESRTTGERIGEHQTGNPRPLFIHKTINANAVERVETLLHRRFAEHRGTGEWFKFDNALLNEAITAAHEFSEDTAEYIDLFAQAEALADEVSSEFVTEPTDYIIFWFNKFHAALEISKTYAALDADIRFLLREAVERGEQPRGVRQQKIKYSESFNKDRFETEQPELFKKYLVTTQQITRRFTVKKTQDAEVIAESIDADLIAIADEIRVQIDEVRDGLKSQDELQPLTLWIKKCAVGADWDKEIAEMHLRVATGTSAGIEGICSWSRKISDKVTFDENAFKGENFEIYKEFIDLKKTGGNIIVDPGQAPVLAD